MSFFDCVANALKNGRVTQNMYKGLEDYFDQHGLKFNKDSDFTTPENQKLLQDAIKNYTEVTAQKKKELVLALEAKGRNEKTITDNGGKRPVRVLTDTLQSIENRASVIRAQWASMMDGFFQKYAKGNFLGNLARNEIDRDKFGQEMMAPGSSKSGEHAELAKTVQKVMNDSVIRRSDAGMDIKRLSNYGLPTSHDGIAIGRAGFHAWADSIMRNVATIGGTPLKAIKDLNGVLKEIFDSAKSQHAGLDAGDPLNDHRVISFGTDYEKWKAYNKDFGMSAGDPVNAIESHLRNAADSSAMMEQLGPKPVAMVKYLRDFAFKQAGEISNDTRAARRDLKQFDNIWRGMTQPDSPLSWAGATYAGLRSAVYMRIAEVAYLSQGTMDLMSRVPTLKMINGLPASSVIHMFTDYLPSLASDDARQMAIKMGVGGDNLFNELHKGNDQVLREHPILGRVQSINEPIARMFAVHAHMETLPRMMGMDFVSNFARWKDMEFDKLPISQSMQRHGITQADWDAFRATSLTEQNGMKVLTPVSMLERADMPKTQLRDIATRIGMYINAESRETIPAPNLKNRYALVGNFDPNSVAGMIVKDATIALQFTASTLTMLTRGFMLRQGLASKVGFAASAGTALMVANAARMQAKAIAAGRDPYNMNPTTPEGRQFWKTNIMTSGFAGPSLDLLNPEHTGSVSSLIGKTAKAIGDEAAYQVGWEKKNPNAGAKIFKEARHFVPGADGWYTQLIAQHGILDAVQKDIDPQAQSEWNRTNQYYQHTYGQQPFWKQGQATPSRAPNFNKAFQ